MCQSIFFSFMRFRAYARLNGSPANARMPGAAMKFAKAALNHQQETAGLPS
jgi:hypothetical protein